MSLRSHSMSFCLGRSAFFRKISFEALRVSDAKRFVAADYLCKEWYLEAMECVLAEAPYYKQENTMVDHKPEPKDKVYSEARKAQGKQPNGEIVRTFPEDVLVCWLSEPTEYQTISMDALDGTWNVNFPNTFYMLEE